MRSIFKHSVSYYTIIAVDREGRRGGEAGGKLLPAALLHHLYGGYFLSSKSNGWGLQSCVHVDVRSAQVVLPI